VVCAWVPASPFGDTDHHHRRHHGDDLLHLPGVPLDPLAALRAPGAAETVERLRTLYGFDQPLYVQFAATWRGSPEETSGVFSDQPTGPPGHRDLLSGHARARDFAILVGIGVGIPLGVLSAVYKNRAIDHFCRILSLIGVSTPVFWLGLVLMLVFYFKLGWLPEPGRLDIMLLEPARSRASS